MPELSEKLVFSIETPKPAGGGLSALVKQLEAVDSYIGAINKKLAGMNLEPQFARTFGQLQNEIKRLQSRGGGLGAESLAKGLGFDPAQVTRFFDQAKRELKGYQSAQKEFASAPTAAAAFNQFAKAQREAAKAAADGLRHLFTPKVSEVQAGGIKVEGPVHLNIPAASIQASVEGVVTLVLQPGQLRVEIESPNRNAATGQFVAGGGGGGGGAGKTRGKAKGSKQPLKAPGGAGEIGRVRVETEESLRETVTEVTALGETVSKTYDSVENLITRTVTRTASGRAAVARFREQRARLEAGFQAEKAALQPGDYGGLGKLQESQAAALKSLLTPELRQSLGAKGYGGAVERVSGQAGILKAQAGASAARAAAQRQASAQQDAEERFREQWARLEAGFQAEKAALQPGDYGGLGKLQESQAAALKSLLTPELRQSLGAKGYGGAVERVSGQAGILKAQAGASAARAAAQRQASAQQDAEERFAERQARGAQGAKSAAGFEAAQAARQQRLEDARTRVAQHEAAVSGRQRRVLEAARERGTPPVIPPPEIPKPGPPGFLKQVANLMNPASLALSAVKLARYAVDAAVLYKSVELVNYSLERMVTVGNQTARLSQIFRGVGGSAQELTNDIVQLAAANGRGTDEAMEAGIAWARLGLNRVQINEAVRISLMAANVANVEAGDATKYLSSIMAVYGLQVRDLNGVLGMLNNTANKYNVTNHDLFDGIARSAAVAKQAGISLAELQGIIGAAVGRTGQTGSNIGNALKTIVVRLNNAENQSYLRSALKIETLGGEPGQMKSTSDVLGELYVKYQSLTDQERRNLTVRIAGATQASRFVAIMESYVQAQKLAVDSQLNLNSAESENAKILATQKAQLQGVKSAWDAFVLKQGNAGSMLLDGASPNEAMVALTRGVKNAISVANIYATMIGGGLPGAGNPDRRIDQLQQDRSFRGALGRAGYALSNPLNAFNYIVENLQRPGASRLGVLSENEMAARSAASGYRERANLLRRVSAGLPGGRPGENTEHVAGLLGGAGGAQLEQLVRENRLAEAQTVLKEAAAAADEQSAQAAQRALDANQEGIALLREQHGSEASINELLNQRVTLLADIDEASGDFEGRTQRIVDLLERQKTLSETIGELYAQMPADTAGERLENRIGGLRAHAEELGRTIADIERANLAQGDPRKIQDTTELRNQQREAQGQIAALASPANRGLAGLQDDRALAFRRAAEEAQGFGIGFTESDKLLERERRIKEELNRLGGADNPSLNDNQIVRGLQFEIELYRTKEQIQQRLLVLAEQERQIQMEASREFEKSLLLAGPGELLRKLSVANMAARGPLNAGQFFGLSPDARRDYDQMSGGDAMRRNREEQRALYGRRQTIEEQQDERDRSAARAAAWSGRAGTGARTPAASFDLNFNPATGLPFSSAGGPDGGPHGVPRPASAVPGGHPGGWPQLGHPASWPWQGSPWPAAMPVPAAPGTWHGRHAPGSTVGPPNGAFSGGQYFGMRGGGWPGPNGARAGGIWFSADQRDTGPNGASAGGDFFPTGRRDDAGNGASAGGERFGMRGGGFPGPNGARSGGQWFSADPRDTGPNGARAGGEFFPMGAAGRGADSGLSAEMRARVEAATHLTTFGREAQTAAGMVAALGDAVKTALDTINTAGTRGKPGGLQIGTGFALGAHS